MNILSKLYFFIGPYDYYYYVDLTTGSNAASDAVYIRVIGTNGVIEEKIYRRSLDAST